MKRFFLSLVICAACVGSCKQDSKSSNLEEKTIYSEPDVNFKTMSGEFIYMDSVAVFKRNDEIYGVIMNAKAKELITVVQNLDKDPYASFDVTLNAEIKNNQKKDTWPQAINIQNIIKVKPSSNDDSLRLDK